MTLRPTKHSHPDRTTINVALILLKALKKNRVESYTELRRLAKRQVAGGEILFRQAMSLLYLLGLTEYRTKTDSFEYVGKNEAL